MGIRNKSAACLEWIRNYTVHHTKTWLPYGAILLFLAGVWFLWDGPTDRQETIREKEIATRSLSPAFSSSDQTSSAIEKTTAGIQPGRDAPQKTPGRPVFWRHRNRHKGGLSGAERNLSQSKAAGERRAYRPCPPGQSRTAARGVRFHPPGQPGPGHFKKLCDDQGLRPGRYDRRLLRDLRAPRCRRSHAAGGNI